MSIKRIGARSAARLSVGLRANQRAGFDLVKVGDLNRLGTDARLVHCFLQLRHCEERAGGLA